MQRPLLEQRSSLLESSPLEHMKEREDFHSSRYQVFAIPEAAREKLAAYAELTLEILEACDLVCEDAPWYAAWLESKNIPDPYVSVSVDDTVMAKTNTIWHTNCPVWSEPSKICVPIQTPNSIVQLQVMDEELTHGDDLLGFVEFKIADLQHGSTLDAWLILNDKTNLKGTATERYKSRKEWCQNPVAGALHVKMTLEIVSRKRSDIWFAYGIQPPAQKVYTAFKRTHQPMNAQSFSDHATLLAMTVVNYIWRPWFGLLTYILKWQEIWISSVWLLSWIYIVMRPRHIICWYFCMKGFTLLTLKNEHRREIICGHPKSAPLNDEGFALIARRGNSEDMASYLERVVKVMNGKILNSRKFREFAAFCFTVEDNQPTKTLAQKCARLISIPRPVCSYEDVKKELLKAGQLKGDEQFVSFNKGPSHKTDTLVVRCHCTHERRLGAVNGYLGKKAGTEEQYKVTWKASLDDHKDEEFQMMKPEDLETRLDVRFLNNPVVLELIPDDLEDAVSDLDPQVQGLLRKVDLFVGVMHDIVTWKSNVKSLCIVLGCFAIGGLFDLLSASDILNDAFRIIIQFTAVAIAIFANVYKAKWLVRIRTMVKAKFTMRMNMGMLLLKEPFFRANRPPKEDFTAKERRRKVSEGGDVADEEQGGLAQKFNFLQCCTPQVSERTPPSLPRVQQTKALSSRSTTSESGQSAVESRSTLGEIDTAQIHVRGMGFGPHNMSLACCSVTVGR